MIGFSDESCEWYLESMKPFLSLSRYALLKLRYVKTPVWGVIAEMKRAFCPGVFCPGVKLCVSLKVCK